MRIIRHREPRLITVARRNRLEIVKAGLGRREMFKHGLIGSSGYLAFKSGLSQWASDRAWAEGGGGGGGATTSPPTRSFIEPLPIMPVRRPVTTLAGPPPTVSPNAANGEGRTRPHQAFTKFPAKFVFPPAVT